jgi:hypothetical protein
MIDPISDIFPKNARAIITLSYRDTGDWATLATVSTDVDGSYSYTWTPSTLGSYQLQAMWAGDTTYDAALSTIVALDVSKIQRSISCIASTSALTIGESVMLSGATNPSLSGETITLFYRGTGAWEILETVMSLSDGSYSYTWTPPTADSYQLQARWPGDVLYADASSNTISLTVNKLSNAITCEASSTAIMIGESLTLSGALLPIREGIQVSVQDQTDSSWTTIQAVTIDSQGNYAYMWTPEASGIHQVKAICSEDDSYSEAISSVLTITVNKQSISISCAVSSPEIVEGNEVTVSGSLNPAVMGVNVTLTYTKPDTSTITRTVTSGSAGDFSDTYNPTVHNKPLRLIKNQVV